MTIPDLDFKSTGKALLTDFASAQLADRLFGTSGQNKVLHNVLSPSSSTKEIRLSINKGISHPL